MLKVYCGHQISGASYESIMAYYEDITVYLRDVGVRILNPMLGKEKLRNEVEFKSVGYDNVPCSTNHAIKERDQWMVRQSDVVWMNFLGCSHTSIGMVSELAWADILGKHTIVTMEEGNIHEHAFVSEMADIVYRTTEESLDYLSILGAARL